MNKDTCNIKLALTELKEDLFHVGVCADQAKMFYIAELMYIARKNIIEAQRHLEERDEEVETQETS